MGKCYLEYYQRPYRDSRRKRRYVQEEVHFQNKVIRIIFIIRLIIYDKKGFFSLKASDEVGIKWSQIKKIGTDVILVTKNT